VGAGKEGRGKEGRRDQSFPFIYSNLARGENRTCRGELRIAVRIPDGYHTDTVLLVPFRQVRWV
jgi:hypothetical protein